MTIRKFIVLSCLFVIFHVTAFATQPVKPGDTITITLNPDCNGTIQWQFSDDLIFWRNIKDENSKELVYQLSETGFFRAKIRNSSQILFSDTSFFYVEPTEYTGPSITDDNSTIRFEWEYYIPRHLITNYLVSIEDSDTIYTLQNWQNHLEIDRQMFFYNKPVTIQAIADGTFELPQQSVRYENNFNRFFNESNFYIAHRGLSASYPENTAIAFEKAAESGFRYIECDVWLTADDIWVIHHDRAIDRTSNGKGKIADYYYDELKKFDFGIQKEYEGKSFQQLLTLNDFVKFCKNRNLKPIIEIKEDKYRHLNLVNLLNIVNEQLDYDSYAIQCLQTKTLRKLRRIDKNVILGFLCNKFKPGHVTTLNNLYPCFYNISENKDLYGKPLNSKDNENIYKLYMSGCFVGVWTINDPKQFDKLVTNKLLITTDIVPPALKKE